MKDIEDYKNQFELIKPVRSDIEDLWREIDEVIYRKQRQKAELQDFTVRRCRNQLASAMQNMILNPMFTWFSVSVVSEEASCIQETIVQDVEKMLMQVFDNPSSNFYS